MGVVANEPSMEDILSSIKRIIADGSDRAPVAKPSRKRAVADATDASAADQFPGDVPSVVPEDDPAILELTEEISLDEPAEVLSAAPDATDPETAELEAIAAPAEPVPPVPDLQASAGILSDRSAQAARESLSHLSTLLVRPREGDSNTLEGLVREMLRPMLKEWLEANLPDLVESMVKKEIDRIVGRLG